MKKYIPAFLLPVIASPLTALALGTPPPSVTLGPGTPVPKSSLTNVSSIFTLFQNVIGWVFVVAIALAVLVLIVAGIMYMTAGGDQAKASKAMKLVMYALIGVAIAALAWALINVIGNYFVGTKLIR